MPRQLRYFIPDIPQHVITRGVDRQAVFFHENDYTLYLEALQQAAATHNCLIHAYVLMTNHVHLLVLPEVSPRQFMQTLKGFTAREANKVLGRTGEPFWQREYYDHWVRDTKEHTKITAYIENNPVRAGLVQCPQDYRWSSAWQGDEEVGAVSPARGLEARNQRAVSKRRG